MWEDTVSAFAAVLDGLCIGVLVGLFVFHITHWKEPHGHREAAGDSDDSHAGTELTRVGTSGPTITFPEFTRSLSLAFSAAPAVNVEASVETPVLRETTADVPMLGYKYASLTWQPAIGFQLQSYGSVVVAADADATCLARSERELFLPSYLGYRTSTTPAHDAPDARCRCGFYAVRNPDDLESSNPLSVRLDVELSGRVIVHEHGYRAQHQRVLRAHPPRCFYCGDDSETFWLVESDDAVYPRALCADHKFKAEGDVAEPVEKVMRVLGLPWEPASECGRTP
jgi:hypothetical protein